MRARTRTSRTVCSAFASNDASDFVCTLPVAHAGPHDYVDTMGMCLEHDDCRATRVGQTHIWDRYNAPTDHHPSCPVTNQQVVGDVARPYSGGAVDIVAGLLAWHDDDDTPDQQIAGDR